MVVVLLCNMVPSHRPATSRITKIIYRKISNISRTKYQTLNDSSLVLQLSLPNLLKPGVKSKMKM